MAKGGAVLAFVADQAVGSARFALTDGYLYFERLAVLPAFRGQGVGRAIIAWLEAFARKQGLPEVRLGVRLSIPRNWQLYNALGYRIVSLEPRGEDEVTATMAKPLGEGPGEPEAAFVAGLLDRLVHELRAAEPGAVLAPPPPAEPAADHPR